MAIMHHTRTTHTIVIPLPDEVIGKIEEGDNVEVQFITREVGPMPPTVKLSYSALMKLCRFDRR